MINKHATMVFWIVENWNLEASVMCPQIAMILLEQLIDNYRNVLDCQQKYAWNLLTFKC